MQASIVENAGLMLPKHEKATHLPLLWHAERINFCAISHKRIHLRHLNKRVMRASIVEIVGLMPPKHEKATLLPLLWHASRSCFCTISPKRIYSWTSLNQFLEWIVSKFSSPYDSRAARYELWRFEFSQKTNYWSTTGKENWYMQDNLRPNYICILTHK